MLFRILGSSLRARRGRIGLALLATALGVSVAVALAALTLEVGDDWARTLRAAGPNFVVMPAGARWPLELGGAEIAPPRAGLALEPGAVAALKRTFWRNNVLEAAPELTLEARCGTEPLPVIGTWFDREIPVEDGVWRTGFARLRSEWPVEGRWPADEASEIAVGKSWAESHGIARGDHIVLALDGANTTMLVTGIVTAGPRDEQRAWAPLAAVQRLAGRDAEIDRVWVSALVRAPDRKTPPDPTRDPVGYERYACTAYPEVVSRDLAKAVPGSEVLPMTEMVAGEGAVVRRLNVLMVLLALAALAASVLGLLATSTASVVERSAELGLLRAIGAEPRQIGQLLMLETLVVALGGGTLGWLAGAVAAATIRGDVFSTGSAGSPLFSSSPLLLPLALVLAVVVAAVGTASSLRMALRIDAARALRG